MEEDEFGNPVPLYGEDDGEENSLPSEEVDPDDVEGVDYAQSRNEAETPVETPVETPAIRAEHRPFTPSDNPALNAIAERYDPELAELIRQAARHEQQQGFAAQAYASSYSQQLAREAPELYAPERNLSHYRAMQPTQLQGTPLGEVFVAIGPELDEVQRTGDMKKFKQAVAKLFADAPQKPTPQPARQLSPTERIPSPGSGGGGRPATERPSPNTGGVAGTLAAIFNIPVDEAAGYAKQKG